MHDPAPRHPVSPGRYTVEEYIGLIYDGVLGPDDRVELLEGVIVPMSPHDVPHAAGVTRAHEAVRNAVAGRAVVRCQLTFLAGRGSAPEPDVLVAPGTLADYDHQHPHRALLVIEVADSSLKADRLTKTAIYALARVPEFWIVNLPDACVEVHRDPDAVSGVYREVLVARPGDRLELTAIPGASVAIDDLLPTRIVSPVS